MATEVWEYGELTLFGFTPQGDTDVITTYTARTAKGKPVHERNVNEFEAMDHFGSAGWRLTLISEIVSPGDTEKEQKLLDALSIAEKLSGRPGTVGSMKRFAMARRVG